VQVFYFSEQAGDYSVFVNIDTLGSGTLGQARHGEYVAGSCHDEARAGGDFRVSHRHIKGLRCAQLCGVGGKAVLGLGNAARHSAVAQLCKLLNLLLCGGQDVHAPAAIGPDSGEHSVDTQLTALCDDVLNLIVGIRGEAVDRHHAGQLIDIADLGYMAQQIGHALLQCLDILAIQFILCPPCRM